MMHAHTGPTPATSLNGASSGSINLLNCERVVLQPCLLSTPTALLFFRIGYGDAAGATTLATAEGYSAAGGEVPIDLNFFRRSDPPHLYWLLTDASGTPINGGANDRLLIMKTVRTAEAVI